MQPHIVILAAQYRPKIMKGLIEGAHAALRERGISEQQIEIIDIPGSFELPAASAWVIERGNVDAIVILGAIHKGETMHDQIIAYSVAHRLQSIAVKTGMPIGFGVVTFNTEAQGAARSGLDENNRGREAALTALAMWELKQKLEK